MSEKEIDDFRMNLEQLVYGYMDKIESENNGAAITLIISYHCFMMPIVITNVLKKRYLEKKSCPTHAVFVHGAAVQMYQNEIAENNQNVPMKNRKFPPKFLKWIREVYIQ